MANLQLHPMLVHFPLALTLVSALCLFCARAFKPGLLQRTLSAAGTWNLILGAITALMTLGSGVSAVYDLRLDGGAQYSVSRHVILAVCTSQLIVLLAIWRGAKAFLETPPGWLFLSLLGIACLGLVATGYYGGENVYHYALGVASR